MIKAMTVGAMFTLAACGGGGGGGDQAKVADMAIEEMADLGMELDADCVKDKTAKLSDEDAKKLVEAGPDGDADVSPEAEAIAQEMIACVSQEALVDQMMENLPEGVDADCVREEFEGMDLTALAEGGDASEFGEAMTACITGG
jgi:hypothetical protein